MDKKHRNKLMFWWSLGTAAAIALFWTIYWYITKEVPVITEIKIPFILTWELPFTVSRWWDILLGSIYSVIIIQILRNFEIEELLAIIIRGILLVILPVVVCFLYWSFVILIYIFGDGILSFLGIIKKHGLDDINLFSPTILIISLFCSDRKSVV